MVSLQIRTALGDAPEEADSLDVVPRAHLDGLASPECGAGQAYRLESREAVHRAMRLPVRVGEAILLLDHIWHRSLRNDTAASPRRSLRAPGRANVVDHE